MKLKESIPSNTLKIIELYNKIESGLLDTSPDFQRKLVWKKQHKYAFIETILSNFPFPEIYIASSEIDVVSLQSKELVVDGQQRLNAIVDYIKGRNDFQNQRKIPSFDSLTIDVKKEFLNYPVSVKDLKDIGRDNIKEIFRRINSTEYSLNSNEILNAQYGDGEFAIFCKLLAEKDFVTEEEMTDVIIEKEEKDLVTLFFYENNIFSDNDVKRMFNSQYLMLISSTILEGKYFGRNSKINHYLEYYNTEFEEYQVVLKSIINSIKIIKELKLSKDSYWYNKPNLFTLIIELHDVNLKDLSLNKFERNLLDLEEKVDIYFNGDDEADIQLLSADETKFFEVSRQGSHEFASREHRAKVIREFIDNSLSSKDDNEGNNKFPIAIDHAILIPTLTGLKKSIMDATSNVREFFKKNQIHDYETQEFGPQNKIILDGYFVNDTEEKLTSISLYRSNGRGDYRIWMSNLNTFAEAEDTLAITVENQKIKIYNLTRD